MDFQYFLCSKADTPKGVGFSLYDKSHLIWIGIWILMMILCSYLYRKSHAGRRRKIRHIFGILLIGDELFKHTCLLIAGHWDPYYLPLQLCSFSLILIAIHALWPVDFLGDFIYLVSIPTASMALLFPNWTAYPVLNFLYLQSFTVHILIVVYGVMITVGGEVRPTLSSVPKCVLFFLVMLVPVYFVNLVWDTNFMFLRRIGKGNPLHIFDLLLGNYLYGYPILILLVPLLMLGIYKWIIKLTEK